MRKKSHKGRALSALAFCMGASPFASAQGGVKVQALKLLNENRISYEDFQKLVSEADVNATGIESSFVSQANYASFVSSGNYASFVSEANYANFLSSGNYSNFISQGNYASMPGEGLATLPSPQIEAKNEN